jgi:hypothetical protein
MSFYSCLKTLGLLIIVYLSSAILPAQMEGLHGDQRYSYNGVHSGNWIRTSFYNDGMVGIRYVNPEDIRGEWPINTGRSYINQLIMFVGAEVRDTNGEIRHIVSEGNGCTAGNSNNADSGDSGPGGEWWSMAPLPGFANDDEKRVAMSHWDWSWPTTWPDKYEGETIDPGWPGSWNGYFGKNVLNADQESYYVIDDYNNCEFSFYPDDSDQSRRGLGLRGTIRGFQWSSIVVQDVLFFLYDIENIGTYDHKKMNFGIMSGPIMGAHTAAGGGDGGDDGGEFNLEENLGWHFDEDGVGAGGWTYVALHGLAFFESPGNPYDGIDNDGDGEMGSGTTVTEAMFDPVTYQVNDPVVVIDYTTYVRTVLPMPQSGVVISYIGRSYTFMPDSVLSEVPNNLIDDNLNGLIDENNGSTFGEGEEAVTYYLYDNLKCVDYFSGNGLDNPLIDERRDDNRDNDGDWDALFDDVGLDGVAGTGDPGENDGSPTSGIGTDLPGEPHIDKTDIDESDMIGLTAFNIYTPWTLYPLSNDEELWSGIAPGYLNRIGLIGDTDIMLGSGYFPMQPGQIERFSLGILFGESDANHETGDLFRNKQFAEKAYLENYNFAKAPLIPNLKAIAGDNQVTLIWDDLAEKSYDPLSGFDFEGYRIYRSTDKTWGDMRSITDGRGIAQAKEPLVQFDVDNAYEGYSLADQNGVKFWLGSNTGIVNTWTDSTAKNGYTYYYAVTSYDHGELEIAPIECSKYISVSPGGQIDLGKNVVKARPEAPSAGYIPAGADSMIPQPGSTTTGMVHLKIYDPSLVPENHTFRVTFEDTVLEFSGDPLPMTKTITLIDITNATNPDTLLKQDTLIYTGAQLPIIQGFQLLLQNEEQLMMNGETSGWNSPDIFKILFELYSYSRVDGIAQPADYRIDIGEVGLGHSTTFMRGASELPAIDVNFKVTNLTQDKEIAFAFYELDGSDGRLTARSEGSRRDQIIFLEMVNDTLKPSWAFNFDISTGSWDSTTVSPDIGDVALIYLNKPFLSNDVFEFSTRGEYTDKELAKQDLDKIKVVPNPYVVAASWEQENPYTTGRGPRELHFTHLPPKCKIRIFNVLGQLVTTINHASDLRDGTAVWNMMTKDNLDIAYGVYVYHIDAEGIGEKIGKFAVIK